ncbi:MAG TPA: NAD-binding protein, partial [Ilumatobacteraceae bacterium]
AAVLNVPVVLQGSIVDTGMAEAALEGDALAPAAVEMTRAQIAEPDLVAKLRRGEAERIRPCTRCNQTCQVRDARNPIVTCIGEPTNGHETEDPHWEDASIHPRQVIVVGGGVAGLEAARVATLRGHHVTLHERAGSLGGLAAAAGPNARLAAWLVAECERLGVDLRAGSEWDPRSRAPGGDSVVVQCTGSVPGEPTYEIAGDATVIDIADLRRGAVTLPPDGAVVVLDPIGGPIGVALAEELGDRAILVTPDHIAGNELSRTGDLAPANVRLAQRGVRAERRSIPRTVRPAARGAGIEVELEDRFAGRRRTVECAAVVDCGFRLPDAPLDGADLRAGDCVAPRTVHEAILEGRRAALAIGRLH